MGTKFLLQIIPISHPTSELITQTVFYLFLKFPPKSKPQNSNLLHKVPPPISLSKEAKPAISIPGENNYVLDKEHNRKKNKPQILTRARLKQINKRTIQHLPSIIGEKARESAVALELGL